MKVVALHIFIPFLPEHQDLILIHQKTATTRYKKYGSPGDDFNVKEQNFVLTKVYRMPLKSVADIYYKEEGFNNPEEFKRTWIQIHPFKGFKPDDMVYLHIFKEAD